MFEEILETHKDAHGLTSDTELTADDWQRDRRPLQGGCRARSLASHFPQDPKEQLWGAISAVFGSWQNARAITYRRLHKIPDDWGTAVTVQAMVFGNMGNNSATGVAFTRNPSTGVKELYGEFLVNAQGEDVVAGIRTPQNITEKARIEAGDTESVAGRADAGRLRRAEGDLREARGALPRHAGRRVHHRERQALDAADALRQAHRAKPRSRSRWTWPTRASSPARRR